MSGSPPPPGSRPGRRALFSGPYDPGLASGDGEGRGAADPAPPIPGGPAAGEPAAGRRAVFSDTGRPGRPTAGRAAPVGPPADIHAGPTTAVVECRTCLNRTPMSLVGLGLSLVPSLWIPARRWSRLMRCPACQKVAWCRVEWPRLRGSD
ncbi:MAG TPA: hypothetical protein VFN68_07095 [Acidimicrobiales bacterium]|nr:hypothetical protein [Acidimicrobiales bacterium]